MPSFVSLSRALGLGAAPVSLGLSVLFCFALACSAPERTGFGRVGSDDAGSSDVADQPSCTDRIVNQNESDVDCGGGSCSPCTAGRACRTVEDCAVGLECGEAMRCIALGCGNGAQDQGEVCDDGNNENGDGCSAECLWEKGKSCSESAECSTGVCDLAESGTCEDQNACGNGLVEDGESCDDGSQAPGDGCNAACFFELGQSCLSARECASGVCNLLGSRTCEEANVCGNGTIDPGEACDDGNAQEGDSCSSLCKAADGESCANNDECASAFCGANQCVPTSELCRDQSRVPVWQCAGLEALFDATNGNSWFDNDGWKQDLDISNWEGVTVAGGNVTALTLNGINLSGSLPEEIGYVTSLVTLNLSNNDLTGPLPGSLTQLPVLRVLNLANNELAGTIPSTIDSLTQLEVLSLNSNQFSGTIPNQLYDNVNLTILNLQGNQLNGPIDAKIVQLVALERLRLHSNGLSGNVPDAILTLARDHALDVLRLCQQNGGLTISDDLKMSLNPPDSNDAVLSSQDVGDFNPNC